VIQKSGLPWRDLADFWVKLSDEDPWIRRYLREMRKARKDTSGLLADLEGCFYREAIALMAGRSASDERRTHGVEKRELPGLPEHIEEQAILFEGLNAGLLSGPRALRSKADRFERGAGLMSRALSPDWARQARDTASVLERLPQMLRLYAELIRGTQAALTRFSLKKVAMFLFQESVYFALRGAAGGAGRPPFALFARMLNAAHEIAGRDSSVLRPFARKRRHTADSIRKLYRRFEKKSQSEIVDLIESPWAAAPPGS
jgi:hypothetical protein